MENDITKDTLITSIEAYNAMYQTIIKQNEFLQDNGVNNLLSSMCLTTFTDGGSADPAVWYDWEESLKEIISKRKG
jgi:hypothetical protein